MNYPRPKIWDVINNGEPYQPFPWQAEHLHSRSRVPRLIAACGRRSGKTTGVIAEVVREAWREPETVFGMEHAPYIYVIAPNYELTMKIWQPIWDLFVADEKNYTNRAPLAQFKADHDKNRKLIVLSNGTRIQAKSADDPKSLQGDRVTAAFVDEAHDLNEEAWANFMPALLDSGGRLVAIGVTKGKGRFRSYWLRGQEESEERFYSCSVPSTAHPGITDEMLEEVREGDLTEAEFEQQYLCRWVEDDGTVFKDPGRIFTGKGYEAWAEEGPDPHGSYIMGLDIGKLQDYTVAYVINVRTLEVEAVDRYNGVDYTASPARIASLFEKYNCRFIHMDVTGIGEAMYDSLIGEGCAVIPFKFTNASKQALVNTLIREVERGNVTVPYDDVALKREMEVFEAAVSPGGVLTYNAPKGYHDDCVIALALAVAKAVRNRKMGQKATQEPYVSFSGSRDRRFKLPPLPKPEPLEVPNG